MNLFLDVLPQDGWDELQAMCQERGLVATVDDLRARARKTDVDERMLQVAEYLLDPADVEEDPELSPGDPENCLGNGEHGHEQCCDECDHYLDCYEVDLVP